MHFPLNHSFICFSRGTAAMPSLQCPLEPSKFRELLNSDQPFVLTLDAIEKHISTNSQCHHPPLKDIILHGRFEGTTLLHIACHYGNPDYVKRMVEKWGMDMEATAVYYSNRFHHGRDIRSATPLYVAAHSRHLAVVKYLVGKQADVSSRTSYVDWKEGGRSPLQGALDDNIGSRLSAPLHWPRAIPVAVYLLESGADPNILETDGSPIWTTYPWNADIAAALIRNCLDLTLRNQSKQTLLHIACENAQDLHIIQLLFQFGADPNAVDEKGNAPLHVLASNHNGNGQVIASAARLLLKNGAHLDHVNQERKTAAQIWKEKNMLQHLPEWLCDPGKIPKLKCLSARVIRSNNVSYKDWPKFPPSLYPFVEFH